MHLHVILKARSLRASRQVDAAKTFSAQWRSSHAQWIFLRERVICSTPLGWAQPDRSTGVGDPRWRPVMAQSMKVGSNSFVGAAALSGTSEQKPRDSRILPAFINANLAR
jgi:hypothetical protein